MSRFGIIPAPEPPAIDSKDGLAPAFRAKLDRMEAALRAKGWQPVIRESLRTPGRQLWLYGFGRSYDDGRGVVTNAQTCWLGWHVFGLAADYGDARYEPGNEPAAFWRDLEEAAIAEGLVSGSDWHRPDDPHVQFGPGMKVTPSDEAKQLYDEGGNEAVWRVVGADLAA